MMNSILLQAQPSGGFAAMAPQILFMVAIIGVFYFFMIRPQQKKAKDQKKFIEDIKIGEKVITIGGAHGRVAELDGDTFVMEVERGGRIRFSKSAISLEASKAVNAEKKA